MKTKQTFFYLLYGLANISIFLNEVITCRILTVYYGQNSTVWSICIGLSMFYLAIGQFFAAKLESNDKARNLGYWFTIVGFGLAGVLAEWLSFTVVKFNVDMWISLFISFSLCSSIAFVGLGLLSTASYAELAIVEGEKIGHINLVSSISALVGIALVQSNLQFGFGIRNEWWLLATAFCFSAIFWWNRRSVSKGNLVFLCVLATMALIDNTSERFKNQILLKDIQGKNFDIHVLESKLADGSTNRLLSFGSITFIQAGIKISNGREFPLDEDSYFEKLKLGYPKFNNAEVLIVGFGAGVSTKEILKDYPEARLTVVEIEPQLFKLAKDYFSYDLSNQTQFVGEDFIYFFHNKVFASQKKYDLIYINVNDVLGISENLWNPRMTERLKQALNPEGILSYSFTSQLKTENSISEDFLLKAGTLGFSCKPNERLSFGQAAEAREFGTFLYSYKNASYVFNDVSSVLAHLSVDEQKNLCANQFKNDTSNNLVLAAFYKSQLFESIHKRLYLGL